MAPGESPLYKKPNTPKVEPQGWCGSPCYL